MPAANESRLFDDFFLSVSGSVHIDLIRNILWGIQILAVLGFLYYCVRAAAVALVDSWRLHRSGQGIFEFNKLSNPGTRRFLKFMLKGVLVWLFVGWSLILVALGLVSEDALNMFFDYAAIHSG